MAQAVGLDFGTTNSAVSILDDDGTARLARFESQAGWRTTSPSVLYFEPPPKRTPGNGRAHAGHHAIGAYLQADTKGRFIQSLKSYLADPGFDGTVIGRRKHSLEELIALIAGSLRQDAVAALGPLPTRIVAGRPVTFALATTDQDNSFALDRLRLALGSAGFDDVTFEYEPVAAAHAYEQRISQDEIVLVADFGGGTSDFTLIEVGPGPRARRNREVIGTSGVALAGDAFDRQIVRHVVAPHLGAGAHYTSSLGKTLPVPAWPYAHLERWHHLSFLRSPDTIEMLERIAGTAEPAGRVEGLIELIEEDLGFELHRAVQATKQALSRDEVTRFEFRVGGTTISRDVTRAEFTSWIGEDLEAIAASVDSLMRASTIRASRVDRVFLTGGSSFVPAVRQLFLDRFGAERVTGGDELTSVATGLALSAARRH
jgi:hypothetical chaperone protein